MPTKTLNKDFDPGNFVSRFNAGDVTESETTEGFQKLIDTGCLRDARCPFNIQRTARNLIAAGLCREEKQ